MSIRIGAGLLSVVLLALACSEPRDGGDTGDASSGAATTEASSSSTGATGTSIGTGSDDVDASSSTGSPPGTESGSSSDSGAVPTVPAELLDLADWKLTLPIAARDDADAPREVLQPELADFAIDPWFVLTPAGDAVVFHAHAGGVTTSNSGYPRSELREMTEGGAREASWSTSAGTHTLTITQAITQLPEAKPHVVAGQIHDAEDDVVMIRLEDTYLFVEGGGDDLGALDSDYQLGTVFTVVLAAHDGRIEVYYEDLAVPAVTIERDVDGCYFKAGAYTQSNLEQGDEPDAYGAVEIRELSLVHE